MPRQVGECLIEDHYRIVSESPLNNQALQKGKKCDPMLLGKKVAGTFTSNEDYNHHYANGVAFQCPLTYYLDFQHSVVSLYIQPGVEEINMGRISYKIDPT